MKIAIEFKKQEILDLHHKLLYKQNPIWVNLRDKIRKQSGICLYCGHKLSKNKKHEK